MRRAVLGLSELVSEDGRMGTVTRTSLGSWCEDQSPGQPAVMGSMEEVRGSTGDPPQGPVMGLQVVCKPASLED